MSRRGRNRSRSTKRAPMATAGSISSSDLATIVQALTQHGQPAASSTPMPRPEAWFAAPFSPATPLIPEGINSPRRDTDRPEPRIWQFPLSWNLQITADRLIPWQVLRDAGNMPIFRQCIEARKRALISLDWSIGPTAEAVENVMKDGAKSKADAHERIQAKYSADISRISEFWNTPDPKEGLEWEDWLSAAMEEQLVLDALAIYPRMTYSGQLYGLEIVDGTTIKPLLDEYGGKPLPPFPAYQQILWGFPRGEFVADLDDEDGIADGFSADELIYRKRTVRVNSPYGFSPTERALIDGRLYLARLQWMMAEYSEGTLPRNWLLSDGKNQWTPEQVLEYERLLNDKTSGQTAERFRQRVLPPGMSAQEVAQVAERYRPEYDYHLITLVGSHFNVNPGQMGFAPPGQGLGGAGFGESMETINWRTGTLPDARWWQGQITRVSRVHLKMPRDLEFGFLGLDEQDEKEADGVAEARVRSGRMTINEDRDRIGLPRYDVPEADRPMVITQREVIPIEGAIDRATPPEPLPAMGGQLPGLAGQNGTPPGTPQGEQQANPAGQGQDSADTKQDKKPGKKDKTKAAKTIADQVYGQLADDYPAAALGWVLHTAWSGPVMVPLAQIDMAGRDSWSASKEPDRVARFADRLKTRPEKVNPVVLIRKPSGGKLMVADGHHRTLAAEQAGQDVPAYVGRVTDDVGPWDELHTHQFGRLSGPRPDGELDTAKAAAEVAAFRRWAKKRTQPDRTFEFTAVRSAVLTIDPTLEGDTRVKFSTPRVPTGVTAGPPLGTPVRWAADPDACPVCLANEAETPIPFGVAFDGGELRPPQHPNCRCELVNAETGAVV
jgi:hypothetical protein